MSESPLVLQSSSLYTLGRTPLHLQGLQFRGPRESAGFRASGASNSFYIAYLDEFGHIGPFISRTHQKHNASPVLLVGRVGSYLVAPSEYEDLDWVPKYFAERLRRVAPLSGIRRQTVCAKELRTSFAEVHETCVVESLE